jgi:drug/metabolite transporter (DMT)-like permease
MVSALSFGASTPLAKLLLRDVDPWMLAGLLYLSSGIGLLALVGIRRLGRRGPAREAPIRGDQWLWLALAILLGGVLAPGLLMYGLRGTAAAATALLLNLETIFTVLLAWLVFGEGVDRRVGLGVGAVSAGALALTWPGETAIGQPMAVTAIAGACLGWALDNNVTRKVSLSDPIQIAALKGGVAGLVNVAIALAGGARVPRASTIAGAVLVGLVGYGLSLVCFVRALREIGAARTGAYFSLAPFAGAILSVWLLGEPASARLLVAGALMGLGVWLHLTERHEHEHSHPAMEHSHGHAHDDHHRHDHPGLPQPGKSGLHPHRHGALTHRHPHFPDVHHGHRH